MCVFIVNVQGDDLYVLNYPENVKINQSTPVQNTELADIILSMMGFTVPRAVSLHNAYNILFTLIISPDYHFVAML